MKAVHRYTLAAAALCIGLAGAGWLNPFRWAGLGALVFSGLHGQVVACPPTAVSRSSCTGP